MYRTILAILFLIAVTIACIAFRVAAISHMNVRYLETMELTSSSVDADGTIVEEYTITATKVK